MAGAPPPAPWLSGGCADVKAHPWLKPIPWEKLKLGQCPAPYVPDVEGKDDTSCFEPYDLEMEHPGGG